MFNGLSCGRAIGLSYIHIEPPLRNAHTHIYTRGVRRAVRNIIQRMMKRKRKQLHSKVTREAQLRWICVGLGSMAKYMHLTGFIYVDTSIY